MFHFQMILNYQMNMMKVNKKVVVETINKSKDLMLFNVNQSDKSSVTTTLTELKKLISKGDYQITVVKI